MPAHDFQADGKAHASAFVLASAMQAFKRFEYSFHMLFVETNSLIFNANFMESVFQRPVADSDHRRLAFFMKF